MSTRDIGIDHAAAAPAPSERRARAYLLHPFVDFLCLGGASLIVLPLMALLLPSEGARPAVLAVVLLIAYVVNYPHFAHSYQIFYRAFRRKALGADTPRLLRARYLVAGLVVPAALILFFIVSVARADAVLLGTGVNAMLFFVGWHYTKQGYGMIIVDSVLKRRFFTEFEKKCLLVNSYACWMLSWLVFNRAGERAYLERDYLGLGYHTLGVPMPAIYAAAAVTALTSALVATVLIRRARAGRKLPVNGLIAYGATLYVWLFAGFHPLAVLIVPAFHSLQYLAVVWRYQLNIDHDRADARERPGPSGLGLPPVALVRFARFAALGVLLGALGFSLAPELLDSYLAYDRAVFGQTMFMFMFWIFINIHHYFLDNVMWRKENPETRKYLFAHTA